MTNEGRYERVGRVSGTPRIRGTHPYIFRSGQWAKLTGVELRQHDGVYLRPCYLVEFDDGVRDSWPVYDIEAGYQFKAGE